MRICITIHERFEDNGLRLINVRTANVINDQISLHLLPNKSRIAHLNYIRVRR